jgi:hypothetical protein
MFMLLKQGIPAAACKSCRRFLSDGHSPTCPSVIGVPLPERKWGASAPDKFELNPLNGNGSRDQWIGYIMNGRWALWTFIDMSRTPTNKYFESARDAGDRLYSTEWRLGSYNPATHNMDTNLGLFKGTLAEAKLKLKEAVKNR